MRVCCTRYTDRIARGPSTVFVARAKRKKKKKIYKTKENVLLISARWFILVSNTYRYIVYVYTYKYTTSPGFLAYSYCTRVTDIILLCRSVPLESFPPEWESRALRSQHTARGPTRRVQRSFFFSLIFFYYYLYFIQLSADFFLFLSEHRQYNNINVIARRLFSPSVRGSYPVCVCVCILYVYRHTRAIRHVFPNLNATECVSNIFKIDFPRPPFFFLLTFTTDVSTRQNARFKFSSRFSSVVRL